MITRLNLAAPPPASIQRVSVVKLIPPLVRDEQYCCLVSARKKGDRLACAIVRSGQAAHDSEPDFAALLPALQAELWPNRHRADIVWIDVVYTDPESARPQLAVRTTTLRNATAELVWEDRDLAFVAAWEPRLSPGIDVLRAFGAQPGKPWSRLGLILCATMMRHWRRGRSTQ